MSNIKYCAGVRFKKIAVGGTFDQFHKGHKILLDKAFSISNFVVIGLSSDCFTKKLHKPHQVDNYKKRLKELTTFLKKKRYLNRTQIVPINDRFGISITDPELDAIIVSKEKKSVAIEINKLRSRINMKSLEIIIIEMVLASDNRPISTTRIRRGFIDKEGKLLN